MAPIQPRPPLTLPPVVNSDYDPSNVQNAFFAATVIGTTASSTLKTTIPAPTSRPLSTDNDWSSLSFSALKKKPLTEIIAYLQSKGYKVSSDDGKLLSKSQLLDAVFSI
jgi:hypothetical protein